jgi:GNAT superfamily N-acetyltransferase
MEVEELFVRPRFRRNGYGTRLIRSIRELTLGRKCHLKGWISYADVAPKNLMVFTGLVGVLVWGRAIGIFALLSISGTS